MKVLNISIAVMLSSMSLAHAGETINFVGEITEATCSSSVAGGSTVTLPTISKSSFASNETAGRVQFVLNMANCTLGTSGKTKVSAFFAAASGSVGNVNPTTGYLNNTDEVSSVTGAATGVQLQLVDSNLTPIKVGYASQTSGVGSNTFASISGTDPNGTANLTYYVEYIKATPATIVTAGTVKGNVIYDLMYQ